MPLKIHFLNSHLDSIPNNSVAVSDGPGERFHQDTATMEKRYQEKWDVLMFTNNILFVSRDIPENSYKR